jgi:hypothetical protein
LNTNNKKFKPDGQNNTKSRFQPESGLINNQEGTDMNIVTVKRIYRNAASLIILLWVLFMFGCKDPSMTGKQVIETSPQKVSKQMNEEKSPESGKQESETKTQENVKAVKVTSLSQIKSQPVTVASEKIAGRYVNENNPSAYIEISNNGTYVYTLDSRFIAGNYVTDGTHIALFGNGQHFEGKIDGANLISSTGIRFVKRR